MDPWDPRQQGWEIRDKPAQRLLRSLGSLWCSQEEAPAAASGEPEHPPISTWGWNAGANPRRDPTGASIPGAPGGSSTIPVTPNPGHHLDTRLME